MSRPLPRERSVLVASLAAIALHIVVVAATPSAGTGLRDHVVPTVIPLAILGLAIAVVLRARSGVIAVTALVLGVWSLVGAGVAAAEVAGGHVDAAAATGLLLAAAGASLMITGSRLLWRTRHHDGRWVARRVGLGLLAALLVVWLVVPVSIAFIATHRPRGETAPPALGPSAREVTLTTRDGLTLHASYVPSRNRAAVVLFPERRGTAAHARMLARNGYGVLSVDMRGYGASDGDPNAFGWGATPDVDAAVGFLSGRPDVQADRIGGVGLSVGGEVLLEAAATNSKLEAVVSDGAGERSVRESVTRGAAAALVLPLQAVQTVAVAIFSGDRPPQGLQDLVPRIAPRSVLLILAGNGGGGEELNRTYASRAGAGTQLWEIAEASHTGGILEQPAVYERRVIAFLDNALEVRR